MIGNTRTIRYFAIAMLFFLLVWAGGIALISDVSTSHGEHESGCTFTLGEHVFCTMDLAGYFSLLQKLLTIAPTPFAALLLLTAILLVFLHWRVPREEFEFISEKLRERSRTDQVTIANFYSELFSQGILHPKAP